LHPTRITVGISEGKKRPIDELPKHLDGLHDDIYRSLAGFVRAVEQAIALARSPATRDLPGHRRT
jgi:hypothetical protein